MNATEAEVSRGTAKAGRVPPWEYYRRKYERLRRQRRQPPWVPGDVGRYQDQIARAVAREAEHLRAVVPERGGVMDCVFRCVCCGQVRGDEERREPDSEVCVRCVEDAGFWN